MTKQIRKRLFYLFAIIFFATIPLIVFYTQGYRVDFDELKVVETGGMDLDISNSGTRVYLNDELEKETIFIFRSAVFRNILPGTYKVLIEKTGYQDWVKTVQVEAGRVAKYISIRLFPQEMQKTEILTDVRDISMSPNDRFAIVQMPSSITTGTSTQKTIQISMLELNRPSVRPILALAPSDKLIDIGWSSNSDIFYMLINGTAGKTLYTGRVGEVQELTNWNPFLRRSFPAAYNENNIIIMSNSTESLFVLQEEPARTTKEDSITTYSLSRLDLNPPTIRPNIMTGITAASITGDDIFYTDEDGIVYKSNISSPRPEQLTQTGIAKPGSIKEIIVHPSQEIIAISSKSGLYLWQRELPLEKISEQVAGFAFAPDGEKAMYWDADQITVYWLEEVFGPPQRMRGTEEIIDQFSNIQNAVWATDQSAHIAIQTNTDILLAELDSRSNRNIARYELPSQNNLFVRILGNLELYTIDKETSSLLQLNYE
ncbi:MAG: carboxypeptidase-like regulatory domain-containing protein [Candidatus Spechtbacterales bacterium]|nr:carboxypeptidase-like regulatory domain-containing protein [Candidatus Spechtbacterales bacterium]